MINYSREDVEKFFEHNLAAVITEQTFSRFLIRPEEYRYVVVRLTDSCVNANKEGQFWSVRSWRNIQEAWLKKQLQQLSPTESRCLGDQVLFFTGVIRGADKFGRPRSGAEQTRRDRDNALLYNTGWCCRIGQGFYSSAAECSSLPYGESRMLKSLAKHFPLWVVALSRIKEQELLDRISIS